MDVTDPQGNEAGEHGVIILSTTADYLAGKPLKGVVVSKRLHWAKPNRRVEVPWEPGGHPKTGFSVRCAAMCDWKVTIDLNHINSYGGHVSTKYTDKIL